MRRFKWLLLSLVLACAPRALPTSPSYPVAEGEATEPRQSARPRDEQAGARLSDGCPDTGPPPAQRIARYLESIGGCEEDPALYRDAELDARSPLPSDRYAEPLLRALREQSLPLRTCVAKAWHVWPELSGTLQHRIALDGQGAVVAVSTQRGDARNDPIACCLRRELRNLSLPAQGAGDVVLDLPIGLGLDWETPGEPAVTSTEPAPRHLTPEQIRKTVEARLLDVRNCYDAALRGAPSTAGRVLLRFVIDHDGSVPRALVADDQTDIPAIGCCIAQHMRTWVFPPPLRQGLVVVEYPFQLQTAAQAAQQTPPPTP